MGECNSYTKDLQYFIGREITPGMHWIVSYSTGLLTGRQYEAINCRGFTRPSEPIDAETAVRVAALIHRVVSDCGGPALAVAIELSDRKSDRSYGCDYKGRPMYRRRGTNKMVLVDLES